jgi:hypothetical protein
MSIMASQAWLAGGAITSTTTSGGGTGRRL